MPSCPRAQQSSILTCAAGIYPYPLTGSQLCTALIGELQLHTPLPCIQFAPSHWFFSSWNQTNTNLSPSVHTLQSEAFLLGIQSLLIRLLPLNSTLSSISTHLCFLAIDHPSTSLSVWFWNSLLAQLWMLSRIPVVWTPYFKAEVNPPYFSQDRLASSDLTLRSLAAFSFRGRALPCIRPKPTPLSAS